MAAVTVFFTEIDEPVRKALDARKKIYSLKNRSEKIDGQAALEWLNKKMAYCKVTAKSPHDPNKDMTNDPSSPYPRGGTQTAHKYKREYVLEMPTKGGVEGERGLYVSTYTPKSSNDSSKYFPKPHLVSVRISSDGDYGTTRKAEIDFHVYTLEQLDEVQALFDIRADIEIEYGWNEAGRTSAAGSPAKYVGQCYNFSYSLQKNGTFACKTYVIGAGINPVTATLNARKLVDKELKGQPVEGFSEILRKYVGESTTLDTKLKSIRVKLPTTWGGNTEADKKSGTPTSSATTVGYVSLERLVIQLNKLLKQSNQTSLSSSIRCDGGITVGVIPPSSTFLSSDPMSVLFPGRTDYSRDRNQPVKTYFNFGVYEKDFVQKGDLSKIMLNIDWLVSEIDEVFKLNNPTVGAILQRVFRKIRVASGEKFSLALVGNTDEKTLGEYNSIIIDENTAPSNINIYTITAVTEDSICRAMGLDATLPAELQARTAITAMYNKDGPITGRDDTYEKKEPPTEEDFNKAIHKFTLNPTLANQQTLQTLLRDKRYSYNGLESAAKDLADTIIYPINLTVTLDGINGFKFGNTITCNYLPKKLRNPETGKPLLCFTVTRVDEEISNNDWTTTLNTVCRLMY